jgi:hypothetical protein
MDLRKWSNSEIEYGRKVLDSGIEGIRSGRDAFLEGNPFTPFLNESARKALKPAALGACVGGFLGALGAGPENHRSIGKMLIFGLLGGAIGFSTAMAWEGRRLAEIAASEALRNIHKVRDEHWVEKHPVAYA